MCPLVCELGHVVHVLPSLVHQGIYCLRVHDCRRFLYIFLVEMRVSLLLHLAFLYFRHTAVTLLGGLLFILVAQYLETVLVTFFRIIITCRATSVVPVEFRQLLS